MRSLRVLCVVALLGVSGLGATLNVGASALWHVTSHRDLNAFIELANSTLAHVNSLGGVTGEIPLLSPLRGAPGLSVSQSLGSSFYLGGAFFMSRAGAETSGEWLYESQTHPVKLKLELGMMAGGLELGLSLLGGLFEVAALGGWGWAWLDYTGSLSAAGGWHLSFLPHQGSAVYRGGGPIGQVVLRVFFPLRAGLSLGTEAGLRYADFGVPRAADGTAMDLDRDGVGDRLDLGGMWIGVVVRLAFDL